MSMSTKLAALVAPLIALSLAAPARAGYLTNGNFEQFTGGYNNGPSQLGNSGAGYSALTGWTIGSGTYGFLMAPGTLDTTGSYSPQFGNNLTLWGSNNGGSVVLPSASPDGGNFLALDASSSYHGAGISQTITGLTAGKQYYVSFDWASGQQKGYDGITTESMQVSLGGSSQTTNLVTNASHGFTTWQKQTFVFTADGTSDVLNFLANGSPSGQPPFVLLDGVTFAAVPEPASLAMVGLGLGGTALVRRLRRRPDAAM